MIGSGLISHFLLVIRTNKGGVRKGKMLGRGRSERGTERAVDKNKIRKHREGKKERIHQSRLWGRWSGRRESRAYLAMRGGP